MNFNKLCCIFRKPALYRESIHRLMDKEFNIDWYFGDNDEDVKCYNTSFLKHCTILPRKTIISSLYYVKGELGLLFRKDYNTYLMLNSTHNISVWCFALMKYLFFRKKRLYYWCHGWYGKESFLERVVKKFLFRTADGIFTYGEYARNLMIKEGIEGDKIFPIHNSLDHKRQVELRNSGLASDIYKRHFRKELPLLIFIGRLTAVKRLDMIIHAMAILKNQGHDYNLVFVGDGKERERLESLIEQEGLEEYVWFYGACYDEDSNAKLIYNADLCVAPGNIGLTAMHSLVFGTPAITHNCFGWQMPEFEAIKEGKTGAFFERNNVQSLAESIQQWFDTHHNREHTRQECYREIDENWTPEYQIKMLKNHISLR